MSMISECVSYNVATSGCEWRHNESHFDQQSRFMHVFADANEHVDDIDIAREIEHLAHWAADSSNKDNADSYMSDLEHYVELLRYRIDQKFADDEE